MKATQQSNPSKTDPSRERPQQDRPAPSKPQHDDKNPGRQDAPSRQGNDPARR